MAGASQSVGKIVKFGALLACCAVVFAACEPIKPPGNESVIVLTDGLTTVEWDGGDGGYSPSIVAYPGAKQGKLKIAVAFQSFDTDNPDNTSIELLRASFSTDDEDPIVESLTILAQENGRIGDYLSMVLLPESELLVVVYYDAENGQIRSLWETDDGEWVDVLIDGTDTAMGKFLSAAADPIEDIVYVSYLSEQNDNLRYAALRNQTVVQGGAGSAGLVDTGFDQGAVGGLLQKKTSIDVGPAGNPAISYYDASNGQMRVAVYDSTVQSWEVQVVGIPQNKIVSPNSKGEVTISDGIVLRPSQITVYRNGEAIDKDVTIVSDGTFAIPDYVDDDAEYEADYIQPVSSNYGQWNSIRFDGNGVLHAGLFDFQAGTLRVATNTDPLGAGQWEVVTADGTGTVGDKNAMAVRTIESNGNTGYQPIVSYYDGGNADVRVALRSKGSWIKGSFDSAGFTGLDTDIAAFDDNFVVVAYRLFDFATQRSSLRLHRFLPEAAGLETE